jgi:HK97 family phage portal protein
VTRIAGPATILAATGLAARTSGLGQIHTATDGRDILLNTPDGWEVDEPWRWWDGPAGGDGTGGPWGNPPPGADGGAWGSPGGYLAVPAFLQCTNLIAEQIAAMPWQVYGPDGSRVPTPAWISDPHNARLDGRSPGLDEPQVRLSRPEFWSQVITSVLWFGEAIIYTPRGADGQILAPLWLLHPDFVEVDGGRYYVPDPDHPGDASLWEWLDEADIIVVRGHMRPGKSRGFGVLQAFRSDLRLANAVREYAQNAFQRGVPAGYLKVNAPDITEATASKLQARWMASHGGLRKKIAVLNATTDFKPLDLDPQSLELINMMRLTVWEICSMFSVPSSKLGISIGDGLTYNNAQDDDARFIKDTLRVWVDRMETAVSNRLTAGTYMKVNLNSYLRANTTDRYAAYAVALDPITGWMTINEVRALEDEPPLPGGDVRPTPGGAAPPAAAPEPAPAPDVPAGQPEALTAPPNAPTGQIEATP